MTPWLLEHKKGQIDALAGQELSVRAIAKALKPRPDRSRPFYATVSRYLTLRGRRIVRKKPGPKRLLSRKSERRIIRAVSVDALTSGQVVHELHLQCSARTVRRTLQAAGFLRYKRVSRKPSLSSDNIRKRLAFATAFIAKPMAFWHQVVFSDEKIWSCDGPFGSSQRWVDCRAKSSSYARRQHSGGGKVHMWAGMSLRGLTMAVFVEGGLNAVKYQQVLLEALLPFGLEMYDFNFTFQQDNAPAHTANSTKAWLDALGVTVLPWPARSPDLNPIENIWGVLSRVVYRKGRQFARVAELKAAVLAAWATEAQKYVVPLLESMPRRLQAVLDARGHHIKY
ncbi:Transposable element Tc3 transposase [Porphyridium purpureum]|uniref:Transposable element Tc3 transposase n=1 Tax=Porphyridium purpureum TaxID=35688 RepID=A0A5J4YQN2_PORPP|nr:Transposable element Tc3 transposase [Porphyridium purpureum]|eukprot:POR0320..scf222_8